MHEYDETCGGCLSLRNECIVIGLVDFITQIPHIAVDVSEHGDIDFVDLTKLIIGTLLSGLLLYGAIMRNLFCLWLWIFVYFIRTVLYGMGLSYCVIALTQNSTTNSISAEMHEEFAEISLEIVAVLISIHIAVYVCLLVLVHRYICVLLDDREFGCAEIGNF